MSSYKTVSIRLSPSQLTKLRNAIKNNEGITIQVGSRNVNGNGNVTLNLTDTQVDKVNKLASGKQVRLNLSKTQLKSLGKADSSDGKISLTVTPNQIKAIEGELGKLMALNDYDESQSGTGLGAIFKLALPFVKNTLPKVLGTLGMAAATGAVSGATHKATSGKGLRRTTGGKIDLTRNELSKLMELGNACECHKIVKDGFVNKMNKDVKEQRGKFLPMLLGSLAASLIPSLLGKGLKRNGDGIRRAGDKS